LQLEPYVQPYSCLLKKNELGWGYDSSGRAPA
jgi:hypothetical protein